MLGNGPSQTTVLAALKEFYGDHGKYLISENHLPPVVQEACENIAAYVAEKR